MHLTAVSAALAAGAVCHASDLKSEPIYSAWLQMYNLKFEQAHETLKRRREIHPDDPLIPASDAAAYYLPKWLGVLESELFVDDNQFKSRRTYDPDPQVKASFDQCISEADRLSDSALQQSSIDARALFVRTLTHGLRTDYVALINGQGLRALRYTKAGRVYAERLMKVDPEAFDAYLGPRN